MHAGCIQVILSMSNTWNDNDVILVAAVKHGQLYHASRICVQMHRLRTNFAQDFVLISAISHDLLISTSIPPTWGRGFMFSSMTSRHHVYTNSSNANMNITVKELSGADRAYGDMFYGLRRSRIHSDKGTARQRSGTWLSTDIGATQRCIRQRLCTRHESTSQLNCGRITNVRCMTVGLSYRPIKVNTYSDDEETEVESDRRQNVLTVNEDCKE